VAVEKQPRIPASSVVVPLALSYSDGASPSAPARLILKYSEAGALNANEREVEFYAQVAPGVAGLPVIRCYDAAYSERHGRFHLLLEDLSETHISSPPSVLPPPKARAEQIVDAFASLHSAWWDHTRLGEDVGDLPTGTSIREKAVWCEETLPAFAGFMADRLPARRRGVYEKAVAALLPMQLGRLAAGKHLTLTHGDPHVGNFLYPRDHVEDTVRIIDWKGWEIAVGPGDMAHMMAVFWFPERRARLEQALLRRYYEHLLEGGVEGYTWEMCWYDYRFAVIELLFYPIWQWSTNQIPDVIWWPHVERLFLAFEDLGCEELFD
jgi:hypothetical protein